MAEAQEIMGIGSRKAEARLCIYESIHESFIDQLVALQLPCQLVLFLYLDALVRYQFVFDMVQILK